MYINFYGMIRIFIASIFTLVTLKTTAQNKMRPVEELN